MARGKTLRLFLMDGEGSGRVKCTLANWTGIAYKIPHTMVKECQDMAVLKQSGVYFLFGTDMGDNPVVYVGQAVTRKNGEGLLKRVSEPHDSIDDWTEAVMFTTIDNSFGPTEISYLENRFCNMAVQAKRYIVKNGNEPNPGHLTEELQSELDDYIDYACLVMGSLGHRVLESVVSTNFEADKSVPELHMDYVHGHARGKRTSDGFVVFKGSKINPGETATCPETARRNREKYAEKINDQHIVQEDILFSSPSGAACFIAGANVNGKDSWKNDEGKSLNDLEK